MDIDLNIDEATNNLQDAKLNDEILTTLLDRIAKYTVQQNTPPDNKSEYYDDPTEGIEEKISIDEAISDYMQGRHYRKKQDTRDREVMAVIIADRLDIPVTSISVHGSEIIINGDMFYNDYK